MATIRTSIAMHDQMTSSLMGLANALNNTLSSMQGLQHIVNQDFNITPIDPVSAQIVKNTEMAIENLAPSISEATLQQEMMNASIKRAEKNVNDLSIKMDVAGNSIQQIKMSLDNSISPMFEMTKLQELMNVHIEKTEKNIADLTNKLETSEDNVKDVYNNMEKVPPPIEKAAKEQSELNNRLNEGAQHADAFVKKIIGIAAAYLSLRKVKDIFSDLTSIGLDFKSHMQSSEIAFTTMLGSAERAKLFLDELYAFNMTTPFSFPDWVTGARNLIAFGMDEGNVIPTLSAIGDAVGGIGGGATELLQLTDAFGAIQVAGRLSMNEINRLQTSGIPALRVLANQMGVTTDETRKMISSGAIDANNAIAMLVDGIKHGTDGLEGITPAFDGMMGNVRQTWTGALGSMRAAWRDAGGSFVDPFMEPATKAIRHLTAMFRRLPEMLGPIGDSVGRIFETFNQGFENNSFDFFVNSFLSGIQLLANATAWGVEFMVENLDVVKMTLVTLGTVLTVLAAIWLVKWAIAAWPVLAVIGVIVLLMKVLNDLGISTSQVVGFIGGLFMSLFALINNQVALFWNILVSVSEFLANVFIDPVYAIKKLFYDLVKHVSDYFMNMINSLIKGLNWLIEKVNSVTGASINIMGEWSNDWVEGLRPETNNDVYDLSRYRMNQFNLADAFERGYESGAGFIGDVANAIGSVTSASQFDPSLLGKMVPNELDRVGEVGRIRDSVEINNEDLKLMRELAEMRNIQNFVTLTPTVSVQTGDINNGYDVDTIVARIEQKLEEEFVAAAEGVYG